MALMAGIIAFLGFMLKLSKSDKKLAEKERDVYADHATRANEVIKRHEDERGIDVKIKTASDGDVDDRVSKYDRGS